MEQRFIKQLFNSKTFTFLLLFLTIGCFLFVATSFHASPAKAVSSYYEVGGFSIQLFATNEQHYALQNSQFVLQIADSPAIQNALAKNDNIQIYTNKQNFPQLKNIMITLQMLDMNCGTVKAFPLASDTDPNAYVVDAAPLMKGVWVATATFQLENSNETIALSYQFQVL